MPGELTDPDRSKDDLLLSGLVFLPPANEVCEGYVFTRVCHSVHGAGLLPGECLVETPRDGYWNAFSC